MRASRSRVRVALLSSASTPPVRIVSDWAAEAQDIESLLRPDFENVSVHIDSGRVSDAFNSQLPTVLVLAFKELEEAERFYLAHYRHGKLDVQQAHRTVLLCGKGNSSLRPSYGINRKFSDA